MIEAISPYQGSNNELNEVRKALLSESSAGKLSKPKEETPKELSKKEIEKEIKLSSKEEENEVPEQVQEEEIVEEESEGIVVNASEIGILNSDNIEVQANIASNNIEYSEEMDYNNDGEVSDEERIKYYSEKYAKYDSENISTPEDATFDAVVETTTFKTQTPETNQINNNMSLINKMQANYGKVTPEIKSGLSILV